MSTTSTPFLPAWPPGRSTWARPRAACTSTAAGAPLPAARPPPSWWGSPPPIYLVDHAGSAKGLAPEGGGLVHVLHYLPLGDDTPADRLRAGLEEHARLAGVDPSVVEEHRFLLRMTVLGGVPTPAAGGLAGRPAIDSTGVAGVYVAGDWVGPRGWPAGCAPSRGQAAGLAPPPEA